MIGNYWNSAYRNLMKRKKFSFINIFGLAIGMASALLMLTYVTFEFSFDKMHTKYAHIYRVQSTFHEGVTDSRPRIVLCTVTHACNLIGNCAVANVINNTVRSF